MLPPAFASEWTANNPESIQIEQDATSYDMKLGDTLWIISTTINVNINSLASINNIDLSNGQQYSLPVEPVIHFRESEIKAVNSTGQAINEGVKVNDSNKIAADKPIGTDVSKDVADGKLQTTMLSDNLIILVNYLSLITMETQSLAIQ